MEPEQLTLYRLPVSNCCTGVVAALVHKCLPFTDAEPPGAYQEAATGAWRPGYGTPQYKAIVPAGTIPALVTGSGFVLSESTCCVEFIDELAPHPPLLPREPVCRARY